LEEKTCVATQKRKNGKKKRKKKRKKKSGKYGEERKEERGEVVRINKLAEVFLLPSFHFQNACTRP